jgi:tetratricopeptide (TPR) repeat protein
MALSRDEARAVNEEANEAYATGEFERAAELYSSLLIEPEALQGAAELQWNFAMCLAHLDNWPLALEHVRASGYSEQDFRDACAAADLRDAQHDFEQADLLYQNRQWDEAADAFVELLVHPAVTAEMVPELHWNIAMSLAHLGRFDAALEHLRAGGWDEADFRQACHDSDVDLARHDHEAAVRLYQEQRWEEAADAFTALLLNPGVGSESTDEIQWNIAMCLAHLGDWETAFGHIRASGGDEGEFRATVTNAGLTPPDAD